MFAGIVVNVMLVVCPPLRLMFGLTNLSPVQWTVVFLLSASIVPIGALADIFFRRLDRKGAKKARPRARRSRAKERLVQSGQKARKA